ncbi:MAG TPA: SRPBCC domain-containing protein [Actinophytocola sp.]|uniref:SRPBCC domain-containing protein n=1 Tax=Actinophytocola sp. TaxID=1872138 RepID=UPI002DBC5C63|nr:SRPBCC domain-containing protein [Actinophytocola sp.]HEU5471028.1 SRPBCC domain-containing protein [Actinophytocola sp.]
MSEPLTVTTPTDTDIVLTREFDAPRRLVFDALTKPELVTRWYGARGWNVTECYVDLRIGGTWRFVSHGPDGARMVQSGAYRMIEPPELLVYTEVFDDQSYEGQTLITHELSERADRTTLTTTARYASRQARDTVLRYPMRRGVGESFDRLTDLLELLKNGDRDMNWTLEVILVPVADLDRAKDFYAGKLGFNVDHDTTVSDEVRVIQLTPPGSGCSIVLGKGIGNTMSPGSLQGVQLVVADLHKARAQLLDNGVDVSDIQIVAENPSPQPDPLDNVGFLYFSDPDGNSWAVQQISTRG